MLLCVNGAGIAALATSLIGCAKEPEPAGLAKHLCRTWRPITISKNDKLTKPTASDIAATNAANETWCPEPKQPKIALVKP